MNRVRRARPRRRDGQGRPVGYGVPPEEHKFRPGQSGNPKGRPKGSKNESTILRELMERKLDNHQERNDSGELSSNRKSGKHFREAS